MIEETKNKRKYFKKGLDPSKKEVWTPPKPKYSIRQICKKAAKNGMSYGKYVATCYDLGITL